MKWYLAPNLAQIRATVDRRWPKRDHTSDGSIGDARHAATKSDHNPDPDSTPPGVVRAIDLDKDGIHRPSVIAGLILHSTIQYVISQRLIMNRTRDFLPVDYTGLNAHAEHVHASGRRGHEDNTGEPLCFVEWVPTWQTPISLKTNTLQGTRQLQGMLIAHRYALVLDGEFGLRTETKLHDFQEQHGLKVDGIAGPATLAKMRSV